MSHPLVLLASKKIQTVQPTTIDQGEQPVHTYDNEKGRESLWLTLGVSVMSVRHLGTCRNMYTNTLRDAISESFHFLFLLFHLCPILP